VPGEVVTIGTSESAEIVTTGSGQSAEIVTTGSGQSAEIVTTGSGQSTAASSEVADTKQTAISKWLERLATF
jgi:hypothetical protein